MKCPVDSEMLVMTERNGVEIDYCPKCRGVWLDRGELDKVIERAAASASTRRDDRRFDNDRRYDDDDDDDRFGPRGSFLSNLFDFS